MEEEIGKRKWRGVEKQKEVEEDMDKEVGKRKWRVSGEG